ncbi:MAG: hypothetical protein P8Y42_09065, partial [Exilibacterium sp.]
RLFLNDEPNNFKCSVWLTVVEPKSRRALLLCVVIVPSSYQKCLGIICVVHGIQKPVRALRYE